MADLWSPSKKASLLAVGKEKRKGLLARKPSISGHLGWSPRNEGPCLVSLLYTPAGSSGLSGDTLSQHRRAAAGNLHFSLNVLEYISYHYLIVSLQI